MALTTCKKCGGEISDRAAYCVHCGEPLHQVIKTCPSCNVENEATAKFCSNCGLELSAAKESSKQNYTQSKVRILSNTQRTQANPANRSIRKKTAPSSWVVIALAVLTTIVFGFLGYTIIVGPIGKDHLQQNSTINQKPSSTIITPQSTTSIHKSAETSETNQTISSTPEPSSQFYEISQTEIAFNEACHVHDYEKQTSGRLKYKNDLFHDKFYLFIDREDYDYFGIRAFWVEDAALYNALIDTALRLVENWKDEQSYELDVINATIGTIPGESRTARLERLNHFTEQWPKNISEAKLLDILNSKGLMKNQVQHGNDIEFDITDLKAAAKSLEITERFLGYIIAYLGGDDSNYNRIATFQENSVHIKMYEPEPIDVPPPVNEVIFK